MGVYAYSSNMYEGNPSVVGHSAGEINVKNSAGQIVSLQNALDNLANNNVETYEVKGDQIIGLTANKKYLVNVYGITSNRGTGGARLTPIGVKTCEGELLSETNFKDINWHDGSAPQSSSFIITAPASGCINGFSDSLVLYMNAVSLN